jgi:tripartite-type tricarboxylate transporter receptor subunit TctC
MNRAAVLQGGASSLFIFLLLAAAGSAGNALAQSDYPRRQVQIVIPLQAGSGSDIALRALTDRLATSMGQAFLVDNVPGGGGILGAEKIAKAAPDGYMLGAFNNGLLTVLPQMGVKLSYDPFRDFVPIGRVAMIPSAVVVPADAPARSIGEFVAQAKAAPGKLNYSSTGVGSVQHLGFELFKADAGINVTHVPYKGGVQAMVAVVAGEAQASMIGLSVSLQYVKSGRVRALAVTGARRSALLPEVPTMQQAGLPGFEYEPWLALYAPKGTPRPIIDRLNAEIAKALAPAEVRQRLLAQGLEVRTTTPEELGAVVKAESAEMARVISQAGIKGD